MPSSVPSQRSDKSFLEGTGIINPRRACTARVTVLGLSVCVYACLSVCLSTFTLELQATKRHVNGNARLQRNKRPKNNVADLAKTATFWQEKPAPLWTTFRDPTHQLARCACVFIIRLLDWLSPCSNTAQSPTLLLQVLLACFRTVLSATSVCSYIPHGSCCRGCVSQLLARTAPVTYTNRVCAEGLHFSAFH